MHSTRLSRPIRYCLGLALVVITGLIIGTATAEEPARNEQVARAHRLDQLFDSLKNVKGLDQGDAIVAEIWKLWLQSGRPEMDALMQQAILTMGQGPAVAMPILDDIVKRAPEWAEGWNKRATLLYLIGEYDRSLEDIDHVLALEPRHFGALAGVGLIRIEKGEHRKALAAFRRALAINPCLKERGLIPALEREIGERPL